MKWILGFALLLGSSFGWAIEVGDVAPDYTLNQVMMDNSEVQQSLLARNGGKFLLLEFATTWCGGCQTNLPIVSQLSQEIAAKADTKLIYIDTAEEDIRPYIQEHRDLMKFPVAIDSKRVAWKSYTTGYIPTSYLISPEGKIMFKYVGSYSPTEIAAIKSLVGM